ncbi:MAG: class I SAM-dependent rRNA methyltransferase [Pseudomonadota bacterium]
MSDAAALPVFRLKPKADARRLRHGHPWAWADELVLDRRSRATKAGTIAVLEDAGRTALGIGIASPDAKIGFRLLDRDPKAKIDPTWIGARLSAAQTLRETFYAAPFYRLIHAEGDGLPGLIVDRFDDVLVIQPNLVWLEARLDVISGALEALTGAKTIIKNGTGRARAADGLPEDIAVLIGQAPQAAIKVPMNGAIYFADVMGGQKTGLFYDQRDNHGFTAQLAKDARVLDVFSHVGGFGLAALARGATSMVAIDSSAAALSLAAKGAEAIGRSDAFVAHQGDAFVHMARLAEDGAQFDLVIADPPAFAPSKAALTQGLRAYERVARLAAALVASGGYLTLCSCSHAADLTRFRNACLRGIGRAGRRASLLRTGFAGPDHPQHPSLSETGYLKALTFRLVA